MRLYFLPQLTWYLKKKSADMNPILLTYNLELLYLTCEKFYVKIILNMEIQSLINRLWKMSNQQRKGPIPLPTQQTVAVWSCVLPSIQKTVSLSGHLAKVSIHHPSPPATHYPVSTHMLSTVLILRFTITVIANTTCAYQSMSDRFSDSGILF